MGKLDTGCLLVFAILLLSGLGVEACLPLDQYNTSCVQPFLAWERNGTLYQELCGVNELAAPAGNGTEVFKCMLNNTNCNWNDAAVTNAGNLFKSVFGGLEYNTNIICEIHFNMTCASSLLCFQESMDFDSTNNKVLGYYNYFCGQNQYLQKGYSCLDKYTEACPYSSDRALITIQFLSKDERIISLQDLKEPLKTTCEGLKDSDRSCITTNTQSIDDCGIAPLIKTFVDDSRLVCDASDQSRGCVSDLCSLTVANFYLNMSGLFPCTVRLACARITEDNVVWLQTLAGGTVYAACPKTPSIPVQGRIKRNCSLEGTWEEIVYTECRLTNSTIETILKELNDLFPDTTTIPPPEETTPDTGEVTTPAPEEELAELSSVLNKVNAIVEQEDDLKKETVENIVQLQDATLKLVEQTNNTDEQLLDSIVKSIDSLLSPSHADTWTEINNDRTSPVKPSWILDITDRYIRVVQENLCKQSDVGRTPHVSSQKYMYVAVNKIEGQIVFPSTSDSTTIDLSFASITMPAATLANKSLSGQLCFGGSYFTTLGQTLEKQKKDDDGKSMEFQGQDIINSYIVSLSMNVEGVRFDQLDPPAEIKVKQNHKDYESPVCVFWDKDVLAPGSSQRGAWSEDGCTLVSYDGTYVECRCTHLTNFAVLMSPKAAALTKALNIISAVGCGISIFCLLLTIICHMVVWRLVRSDRATILMNLCVALLLALVVFMVGVNRVESRVACAAIAAAIQFLFLAVFFLMFLMGIEILICVVHVFGTKFRIKVLLPLSWLAAALVVGVSLGVTKAKGYGSDKFCWLDTESGLIWAFIGPAAFVIFANFIIMAVVFKKMSSSTVLKTKSAKEKATTTAKSLCVLLPLMGVTWVFGLLAVNEDTGFFAYIFCVVNSLQGLFIFLFHCVFNRQIRAAWEHRQARKRSLQTLSSDIKNRSAINSENQTSEKRRKDSEEQSSSIPPKSKPTKELIKEEDWERAERKKYHKNARRGNIYQ